MNGPSDGAGQIDALAWRIARLRWTRQASMLGGEALMSGLAQYDTSATFDGFEIHLVVVGTHRDPSSLPPR
jgi:hypothetical protein